jgi:hypothetical protein
MRSVSSGTKTLGIARAFAGLFAVSGLWLALGGSARAQDPATTPPPASSEKPTSSPSAPPVTVTGTVEANYTYNLNKPFNSSNTYLYNTNDAQFSLNLADLRVGKQATPDSRYGFLIRPVAGEVARRNFNPGDHIGGPNLAILEGYGTMLIPLGGRDVKVDLGQFATHVGYETIEIGTNNFFSRNFLFQYPSPFYNAGVRASIGLSATTTFTGYIYNRYNGTFDPGNKDLAPGFQLALTPNERTSFILNGLTSRDNLAYTGTTDPDGTYPRNNKMQSVLDLVASFQLSPRFKVVGEGLWRFGEDVAGNDYNVGGGAGYLIYSLANSNTLSLRGEYVSPLATLGFAGGPTPGLSSATVSYELRSGLFPGSRTILEARYDNAGQDFFPGKDVGTFKKNQTTFTIGQVVSF